MFQEDCCLQCGRPCLDGRVYCSSSCEDLDAAPSEPALSPSHSTASSAFNSPYLLPSTSSHSLAFIPPLALDSHRAHHPHPHPKAPSATPMWYDSDEDPSLEDGTIRVAPHSAGVRTHLIYARRPSATNNRSTIPLLTPAHTPTHRRASSRSTTTTSTTTDASGSLPSSPADEPPAPPPPHLSSAARKRANRASLPAHFSLLASPTLRATRPPLVIAPHAPVPAGRPSPSTPKLACPHVDTACALAGASPSSAPLASVLDEARGRRRLPGSGSRARADSRSRRRSPSASVCRRRGADEDREVRGRRRPAAGEWQGPTDHGFGCGRSGLRAREVERSRAR
ncbi:hypothetical protein K488DRAFT_69072 [Vararia minispora EC-137]|uniref:Uncharacterized protein n=1 Tax=Vararia minispora EC-137 TaxID=1314806 RepID=A0ACB8QS99_9AGAM|nr:hypothetical protein K488DRAFT_69072 [Vararia minispora EC-137]